MELLGAAHHPTTPHVAARGDCVGTARRFDRKAPRHPRMLKVAACSPAWSTKSSVRNVLAVSPGGGGILRETRFLEVFLWASADLLQKL